MIKKHYKERNEELWDIFSQLLEEHNRALIRIGELQAENEILKGILEKNNIEIPRKHIDF
jgi:hypothetical protein